MLDSWCGTFLIMEGKVHEVDVGVLGGIMRCTFGRGGSGDEDI